METEKKNNAGVTRPLFRSEGKSLFVSFLELFFRRWILISGIFFVTTFWSWYSLSRAPDTYRATGQVMIRRGSVDAVRGTPILGQQEEAPQVAIACGRPVTSGPQFLSRILPDRLQHTVTRLTPLEGVRHDEGLVYQRRQQPKHLLAFDPVPSTNSFRGCQ